MVSDDLRGLWQAATTLREHRGDGHVAILTEADLDGCEAHVLFAATEGGPPEVLRDNRGWSEHDWGRATSRLCRRGLVRPEGGPTAAGRQLRRDIEQRTDELATQPYRLLASDEVEEMIRLLSAIGRRIVTSGEIPFPNPMGLPEPGAAE